MQKLTLRQRQALSLAAHGLTYDQAANALAVTRRTVELHLTRARERLRAANTAQAVGIAVGRGLIPTPEAPDE